MRKTAIIIAAATALAFSGAAWADSSHGDNGGCQGNCAGSGGAPVTNQGGNAAGGVGVGIGVGVGLGIGQGGAGGNANATGGDAHSNATGGTASNAGNSQTVNVGGDSYSYRAPASTAYAPNIMPSASCMGASSAGAQGVGFGVSFGGSWTSSNCETLEQVRVTAQALGDSATAAEMMCGAIPAYKAARERTGRPCATSMRAQSAVAASVRTSTEGSPYVN